MSVLEQEKAQIASLSAKLDEARKTISAQDKELNALRNKVVALEDVSVVDDLEAQVASLAEALSLAQAERDDAQKVAAKLQRDLTAAGPALALAAAVAAVKA